MPKVSINILTKNRPDLLAKALRSILDQSFQDYEVVIINDGSIDNTKEVIKSFNLANFLTKDHVVSVGITKSRQEALEVSTGEYIAILDDDDEWVDTDKLAKQVKFLEEHKDCVLVGGAISIKDKGLKIKDKIFRPETDARIRVTMLYRNNFFTSTVMFRRQEALDVGGFEQDKIDLAEDYDLWLRLGKTGKMYNFQEVFTLYRKPVYNKEKLLKFYEKQLNVISRHRGDYPFYFLAVLVLKIRMLYEKIF